MLFFHAMGVTGASSEPIARYLQDRYFCILPTSTVYCEGQKYVSKLDEIRQVEDFLHRQGVERLAMVVASSIGADLAMAFLTQTKLPVEHAFFDGGQFAQIGKGMRRTMTPFLYFAIQNRAMRLHSVVLPLPEGPTMATVVFSGMVRDTSCRMGLLP